jgi:hypothetical protein
MAGCCRIGEVVVFGEDRGERWGDGGLQCQGALRGWMDVSGGSAGAVLSAGNHWLGYTLLLLHFTSSFPAH